MPRSLPTSDSRSKPERTPLTRAANLVRKECIAFLRGSRGCLRPTPLRHGERDLAKVFCCGFAAAGVGTHLCLRNQVYRNSLRCGSEFDCHLNRQRRAVGKSATPCRVRERFGAAQRSGSSRGCGGRYLISEISEIRCARETPGRRFVFRTRASANRSQIEPDSARRRTKRMVMPMHDHPLGFCQNALCLNELLKRDEQEDGMVQTRVTLAADRLNKSRRTEVVSGQRVDGLHCACFQYTHPHKVSPPDTVF